MGSRWRGAPRRRWKRRSWPSPGSLSLASEMSLLHLCNQSSRAIRLCVILICSACCITTMLKQGGCGVVLAGAASSGRARAHGPCSHHPAPRVLAPTPGNAEREHQDSPYDAILPSLLSLLHTGNTCFQYSPSSLLCVVFVCSAAPGPSKTLRSWLAFSATPHHVKPQSTSAAPGEGKKAFESRQSRRCASCACVWRIRRA